jgi:hypothetical protein
MIVNMDMPSLLRNIRELNCTHGVMCAIWCYPCHCCSWQQRSMVRPGVSVRLAFWGSALQQCDRSMLRLGVGRR